MFRHITLVGFFTLLSRLLGFFRDRLFAAVLGTGPFADAFFVAFRFPNLFRRIFAEGAFNLAFVPLYAKKLALEGQEQADRFCGEIVSLLVCLLLLLIALFEVSMPVAIYLLSPGFDAVEGKIELATLLSRITFPYLLFSSLMALFSGVLNAHKRFAMAAFAPVLLNLFLWSALFLALRLGMGESEMTTILLSSALFAAGIAQALSVFWAMRRLPVRLAFRRPRLTPDVRRFLILGLPAIIAGGVTQLNLIVGSVIASSQEGAVSFLYYADRIYQLPLALVGAATGVVLLPTLTRAIHTETHERVRHLQNRAFDFGVLLSLPAATGLFVVALPIISVVFEQEAFGANDSLQTSAALRAYALGLPAFILIRVLQPAFFARENMLTPTRFAALNAAINIVLSLILFPIYGHVGIAIATTIAAGVHLVGLIVALMKQRLFLPDRQLAIRLALAVSASLVMAFVVSHAADFFSDALATNASTSRRFTSLGLVVLLGMTVYAGLTLGTRIVRLKDFKPI